VSSPSLPFARPVGFPSCGAARLRPPLPATPNASTSRTGHPPAVNRPQTSGSALPPLDPSPVPAVEPSLIGGAAGFSEVFPRRRHLFRLSPLRIWPSNTSSFGAAPRSQHRHFLPPPRARLQKVCATTKAQKTDASKEGKFTCVYIPHLVEESRFVDGLANIVL